MQPLHTPTLIELEQTRLLRQASAFEARLRSVSDETPATRGPVATLRALVTRPPHPDSDDQHLPERAEFDGFSCAAERTLAGSPSHVESLRLARILQRRSQLSGADRAVAFARTYAGEAALLAGFLRLADRQLSEAAELHRAHDSLSGEAHALHLLARLRFAEGDEQAGRRLLEQALPRAAHSRAARHLVPRIYGTMVATTRDADAARALVATMESVLRVDTCASCRLPFELAALAACADAGDLEGARRHEQFVWASSRLWAGTTTEAEVSEALAHLAAASGLDPQPHLQLAIAAYDSAGQPLDVQRCIVLRRELAAAA